MGDATNDLLGTLAEFVPHLVGAVAVLLVALVLAVMFQCLLTRFLQTLGLAELFERTGAASSLWQLGYEGGPSRLLGSVLFWGVMLTGLAGSLSVLGDNERRGARRAGRPRGGGGRAARLQRLPARRVLTTIVAVSALLAAVQLGLETYVVVLLAVVVLATVGLVTALALGQGLALLSSNIAAGRYVQDGTEVGDVISVDGVEGTIEELGYASITVRSEDGHLYRIPNRTLLENVVRKRA
jgi:small-conductance mechanosensitive channel